MTFTSSVMASELNGKKGCVMSRFHTIFKALTLVTFIGVLGACVTKSRNDDFAGVKDHLNQEIMIDANRDERPLLQNLGQRLTDKNVSSVDLKTALRMLENDEWKMVNYDIDNSYDKSNPNSPFHDKYDAKTFYHPPLYKGYDLWVNEKGADVNATVEYWLAMDAITQVIMKKIKHTPPATRIGGVRPDFNVYGRKIHPNDQTYPRTLEGLNNMLTDMLAYGVDKQAAMVTAHLCNGKWFNYAMREQEPEYYKVAEENITRPDASIEDINRSTENQKAYYLGYVGPIVVTSFNPSDCDEMRQKVTKDENSPFWGDKLYDVEGLQANSDGKYSNQTITEIRIENPKLDLGFWQHITNKDLYKQLGRVREEGLFSGLLYPERAKFVVITARSTRDGVGISRYRWSKYFDDYEPLNDARRAAYWMGDTMFSWFWDKENRTGISFRQSLQSDFGNFMRNDGIEKNSIAGCKLNPAQVSFQGDNVREFRKFYKCRMGQGVGYGIFSGTRKGFNHVAARRAGDEHQYQAVFEFNGLTADLRTKKDCDEAEFEGLCKKLGSSLLQDILDVKQQRSFFSFEDALAYTQISEEGQIEGVVLIAGFKVIYDLTDIAEWYQSYHPHDGIDYKNLINRFVSGNDLDYQDPRY